VADIEAFQAAVSRAMPAALDGWLVTFGVTPSRAETGYGYIQAGAEIDSLEAVRSVSSFIEKPEAETAERLVASGTCYWNSGVFLLSAAAFLEEVRHLQPELYAACEQAVADGRSDLDFFRLDEDAFASAPNLSVDK